MPTTRNASETSSSLKAVLSVRGFETPTKLQRDWEVRGGAAAHSR